MKTGISVFAAAFAAFTLSWLGLVYAPLHQLGRAGETTALQSSDKWPRQRTGDASLGLQVYKANGCAACHTVQVRQTGAANQLSIESLGTHSPADFKDFIKSLMIVPELILASNNIISRVDAWSGDPPFTIYSGDDPQVVSKLAEKLKPLGIKTSATLVTSGPDIQRGWGVRQSVAADFLYDSPIQLGALRAGPDLANVGLRYPDMNWHLHHLYAPRTLVKGSTMPAYRHLFTLRKISAGPSRDALVLPPEFAPPEGFEVVPTREAVRLAAYLLSLKAELPLYEAPFTPTTVAK